MRYTPDLQEKNLLKVADRVGFEPTLPLPVNRFSRPTPSTTRPPVHRSALAWRREVGVSSACSAPPQPGFLPLMAAIPGIHVDRTKSPDNMRGSERAGPV